MCPHVHFNEILPNTHHKLTFITSLEKTHKIGGLRLRFYELFNNNTSCSGFRFITLSKEIIWGLSSKRAKSA